MEDKKLTERFEAERARLRGVAFRMLGSMSEADDAVQQAWLHVTRADTRGVENLDRWLTTVVARVCLDMLRARKARREEPVGANLPESIESAADPEQEAALADSVGLALLVVLETLTPAERLAFVLHEMFDLSFDEIAPIVGRSAVAARQLASRARRRVHGAKTIGDAELARQREVVDAYMAAARGGDLGALLALLDPDVKLRADGAPPVEIRGASTVAKQASSAAGRVPFARAALVNGSVGIVFAPRGRLRVVLAFMFAQDKIVAIDVVSDPTRLAGLELAVLD